MRILLHIRASNPKLAIPLDLVFWLGTHSMRRHINTIWFVVVAIVLASIVIFPSWLSRESISNLLNQMGTMALIAYVLLSLSRALLLLS